MPQFPRVAPGSPFRVPAATWNAILDTVEHVQGRRLAANAGAVGLKAPICTHLLIGEGEFAAGAAACFTNELPEPFDPLNQWTVAAAESATDGSNRFCVLPYGKTDDGAGKAVVTGWTWAWAIEPTSSPPPRFWAHSGGDGSLRPWSHGRAELFAYDPDAVEDGFFLGLFMLHPDAGGRCQRATINDALQAGGAAGTATFDEFRTGRAEPVYDTLNLIGAGNEIAAGQTVRFAWELRDDAIGGRWELMGAPCDAVTPIVEGY